MNSCASPGSARYSETCSDREGFDNAILLCPRHHKIIDADESTYTTAVLKEMKYAHEAALDVQADESSDCLDFADSEFTVEANGADRAIGMEITKPASFSNVKATVKAKNVREAIGFSTNQGLTALHSTCPHCGNVSPAAFTGPRPTSVRCVRCGRDVPLDQSD